MSRSRDIVRLRPIFVGSPEEQIDQQDVLRSVLGRMAALTEFALLLSHTGEAITDGDPIQSGNGSCDVTDALLQQWRVLVDGSGDGATVAAEVGGVEVGAVTLGAARAQVASDWSAPVLGVGEQAITADVNGANATLYSVRLQARTIRAPDR